MAIEHRLLSHETTLFDYGCGYGDDVNRLNEQGIISSGWDPFLRPDHQRREADVVNLGYVVNVIEDSTERTAVLRDAWSLARKLLIVSARLSIEAKNGIWQGPYADGFVTGRGTFQKFYEQDELRDWIDTVLGVSSVAAAPGVFYVFQDPNLIQSFAAARSRRNISAPRQRHSNIIFEQNRELFDCLIAFITNRGRMPDELEISIGPTIREKIGTLQRAFAIIRQATGAEQWERICEERSQDLLVYLALNRFGGRPRFSELPTDLQLDIRAFFSNYRRACELADDLLFSAGNSEVIRGACRNSKIGKQTPDALYLHFSALPLLSPVLRVYEGCARSYIGAVEGANVIKLHQAKPQVSYLYYPEFESDPHPALAGSLIVPLQTFHIRYREYSESKNPFILHRKETLLPPDHPLRPKFARLTSQEERRGLYADAESIGTREGWERVLDEKAVRHAGHRLLRRK